MDLLFARSPLLLLLALGAAAAFAWWSYGHMIPRVAPPRRALLAGLRFMALGVLLALLFEPVLRQTAAHEEQPVFAVLIDATRSLAPEDGGGPGARDAQAALNQLQELPAETRFFAFAAGLDALPGRPDSLAFDGARTDISHALAETHRQLEGQNLRGVLLLSDGRYNTGRNPLYLAERYPVPIHTVTLGDTLPPRDVLLADVLTNELAFAGVELPVEVAVQATGYEGERVTVALSEGGRVLAQQAVTLPGDDRETRVTLRVTPQAEGLRRYTAGVTRLPDEATYENNTASVVVRVLSSRRRVLLLAAAPGPDVAALRQELEADPNLEVVPRTQRAPGSYYEGEFPADLGAFDLAVLAGYPGTATARSDAQSIARAAETGLPLLFALTQRTDLDALAATLGEVLPVRPETPRPGFVEGQLHPTAGGALHPVLEVHGAPAAALDRLPPVLYNESRWIASPDAQLLATVRVRGIALDAPLLALRQRGRTRSAALLAAGTWRWRTLPPDLEDLGGFYSGLTQNLVRWLTAREESRLVRVRPTEDLFDASEPVRFTGQVYDERLEPVSDADVEIIISGPDGAELPFPMRPLGRGRYALDTSPLPPGDYTFRARAERGAADLGTDAGGFSVGTLPLELRDLHADAALMRELSRRSGGIALQPDDLSVLPARLTETLTPRRVEAERTTELRRLTPLLALLLVLLTGEWVLRKRSGMV